MPEAHKSLPRTGWLTRSKWTARYGAALALAAAAILLRWALDPILGAYVPFGFVLLAVLAAAWQAGAGPALVTLFAGIWASTRFFLHPRGVFGFLEPGVPLTLAVQLVTGLSIVWFGLAVRRAQQRAAELYAREQEARQTSAAHEREFRAIFELAAAGAAQADPMDGRFTRVNRKLCEITGYSEAELLGRRAVELLHPDDRASFVRTIQRVIDGEVDEWRREERFVRRDGRVVWLQVVGNAIRDEAGRVVRVSAVMHDVTDRKRAESHLELLADLGPLLAGRSADEILGEAARLVGSRLHASRVVIGEVDEARGTISVRHGYTREETATINGVQRMEGMGPLTAELRCGDVVVCRDVSIDPRTATSRSWFEARGVGALIAVPLLREGQWVAVLALHDAKPRMWQPDEVRVVRVVAERTWLAVENARLAEATRRSQHLLQSVLDNTPALIYLKDREGRLLLVNRAFAQLAQLPEERILGRTDREIFGEEAFSQFRVNDLRTLEEPGLHAFEETLELADGVHTYLSIKVASEETGFPGKVLCGFTTDITARKDAELALKETDRRKDEFLAMLAHELRNPLAPIAMAAQVMKMTAPEDTRTATYRDIIERQVGHMKRLLDDLLDISRFTRGRITLNKEPVALQTALAQAMETAAPLIESKHQELSVSIPQVPLLVDADTTRLSQIFVNLLDNAAKYTKPHGHIALSVEPLDGRVEVRVRDDGAGMTPEILAHLFEPFVQGKQALDREQGGLGLGLALVKLLVELHGGTVAAHSAGPGRGAELSVRLPLREESATAYGVVNAGPQPPARVARRRVLVVDDNRDTTETMTHLLETMGHVVKAAGDGHKALELVESFTPEIALLDIGLPGMDGYELARELRRRFGADLLIAALTGYGQARDRQLASEAGFDVHLVKPVALKTIERLLATPKAHAAEQSQPPAAPA